MSYTHFTLKETKYLQKLLSEGLSFRKIAAILERSPSTISRMQPKPDRLQKRRWKVYRSKASVLIMVLSFLSSESQKRICIPLSALPSHTTPDSGEQMRTQTTLSDFSSQRVLTSGQLQMKMCSLSKISLITVPENVLVGKHQLKSFLKVLHLLDNLPSFCSTVNRQHNISQMDITSSCSPMLTDKIFP